MLSTHPLPIRRIPPFACAFSPSLSRNFNAGLELRGRSPVTQWILIGFIYLIIKDISFDISELYCHGESVFSSIGLLTLNKEGTFSLSLNTMKKPHCLSTLCQSLSWSYPQQKWVISVYQTAFRPPKFALEQCTIWFLSKLYRGLVWRPHFFNTDFQTNCFSRS